HELAITQIAIEPVVPVVGYEQVGLAVIVVIANTNTLRPALYGKTRLARDIFEVAAPVIPVKLRVARSILARAFERRAVSDEDVVVAVAVVIEDRDAVARRFEDVRFAVAAAGRVRLGQA